MCPGIITLDWTAVTKKTDSLFPSTYWTPATLVLSRIEHVWSTLSKLAYPLGLSQCCSHSGNQCAVNSSMQSPWGATAEALEGCYLYTCSACFLSQDHLPRGVPTHNGLSLPYQSLSKKISYLQACLQLDLTEVFLSTKSPFFSINSSCVKLT